MSTTIPICVFTDHRNLLHFSTMKKLNRRQVRWSIFLSDFNFQIIFCPGTQGGKPDALSRRSDYQLHPDQDQVKNQQQILLQKEKFILYATQEKTQMNLLEQIKLAQAEEGLLQHISDDNRYHIEDDCLLFNGKIVIPSSMVLTILEACHDSMFAGHPGRTKHLNYYHVLIGGILFVKTAILM